MKKYQIGIFDYISKIDQKDQMVVEKRWFRTKQGAYFQSNLTSKDIFRNFVVRFTGNGSTQNRSSPSKIRKRDELRDDDKACL